LKAAESKTTTTAQSLQAKGGEQQPFFQQQEERQGAFFGNEPPVAKPFFTPFIQPKLTMRGPGNQYEQKADAIKAKPNLTRTSKTIQRYAFINENQVDKADAKLTPEMKVMASDALIRNYLTEDEFKKHANKQTDYLGNLPGPIKTGTWLRFSETGINILGENHTLVTLQDVTPAIGSKNFIRERFSSDDLSKNPNMKSAYEDVNNEQFKKMGIENEKDKQKFGSESLFPKMGYGLIEGLPYFEKNKNIADLKPQGYFGKPLQNYLKIAWAYSKDNVASVKQKTAAKEVVPGKMAALCAVHQKIEAVLDPFITTLIVDGYLGDELEKDKNKTLFKPLAEFAFAFTEAIVEMAATEKSSRLSKEEREKLLKATNTSPEDKQKLFSDWRNFNFEDMVTDAAKRGVRYAGMGKAHLDYLVKVGLPSNGHAFDMVGKDIIVFEKLTEKLKKIAK